VSWLRLVPELLAYGHKPSQVLSLEPTEIDLLVEQERASRLEDHRIVEWLQAFRDHGVAEVRRRALAFLSERDPLDAIQTVISGFVQQVGREWADGRLDIAQEHAITEVFEDLLRGERQRIEREAPARSDRPRLVLATLSGERHGLGLQMAALVLVASGCTPALLGVDLPSEEVIRAVRSQAACGVGLSVSLAHGGPEHGHQLHALRAGLPERYEMLVGGLGARAACRGLSGVQVLSDMQEFERWARRAAQRGKV